MDDSDLKPMITVNVLVRCIKRLQIIGRFPKTIDPVDTALKVLDQPSYKNVVIDNYIDNNIRSTFYRLETCGIMSTFCEFVKISTKSYWRIHFWKIDNEKIIKIASEYDS